MSKKIMLSLKEFVKSPGNQNRTCIKHRPTQTQVCGDHEPSVWKEMFDKLTSNTGTLESREGAMATIGALEPQTTVSIAAKGKGRMSFEDTLGTCRFACMADTETLAEALSAATGWDFNADDAETLSLRIVNLMRVYNFRCGHTRELEAPSPRYGSAPLDGPIKGISIIPVLDEMLDSYYERMGWDKETGKPLPDTLKKLGLEHLIKDI